MTRLLVVLIAIVVLLPISVFAQLPGTIALFSDPGGTDCNLYDVAPALLYVYVVHIWHAGATWVQFSAPRPDCFGTAMWLSDTQIFPVTIGSSQTGVTIGFGMCMPAPTHVLTIAYFVSGLSSTCCRYPVLPDLSAPSGQIEAVDCAVAVVFPTPGRAIINPDASCMCNEPVPVEETSWGQIKALYR